MNKPNQEREWEKLSNAMTKLWWSKCIIDDEIDWSLLDDSDDFSCIPKYSKGEIKLHVGELRSIVEETIRQTIQKAAKEAKREEQMRIYEAALEKATPKGMIHIDDLLDVCKKAYENNK